MYKLFFSNILPSNSDSGCCPVHSFQRHRTSGHQTVQHLVLEKQPEADQSGRLRYIEEENDQKEEFSPFSSSGHASVRGSRNC